jgi:hypothetical protein
MIRKIMLSVILGLMLSSTLSWAQYGKIHRYAHEKHKVEITPFGGYTWTNSFDIYYLNTYGRLDFDSGPVYGVLVNINMVRPGAQLELSYTRQDESLILDQRPLGRQKLFDMSLEHFQIGGSYGYERGDVTTFSTLSFGAARWNPKNVPGVDDEWRFSFIIALGAKVYMSDSMGLRLQFRMPMTAISGGAGLFCGPGGCYTSVGGSGVFQAELSAGLMILL